MSSILIERAKSGHIFKAVVHTMTESHQISHLFKASPKRVYETWLSSAEKSLATGVKSTIEPVVNVPFTEVDDYVTGTNLRLEPYHTIIQFWRTAKFPAESRNSLVKIVLSASHNGTVATIEHENIPVGYSDFCKQDFSDYYFEPLSEYLSVGDRKFIRPELS